MKKRPLILRKKEVHSFATCVLSLIKRVADSSDKLFVVERLDKKSKGTGLHHCGFGTAILMTGNEDHSSPGRSRTQMCQQFHSGHSFHPNVQHDKPHGICCQVIEKIFWFTKRAHIESLRFEQQTDG